jgi:uncharacterized protein YjbI with pentapeptide repeats
MDADRFDALARTLRSATTRRTALSGVVAGVLGLLGLPAAADHRPTRSGRHRSRARDKRQPSAQSIPARCFRGTRCTPGPGANISNCDFGGMTALRRANCRGCNASSIDLSRADASGADFGGANLGGACLVDTDLTGAVLKGAQLGGAIFCRTRMPNGSLDNSGCAKGTACCPTTCRPATCQSLGKECGAWPDGCGGTLSCGRCPLGDTPVCDDGVCARCDAVCACGSCLTLADGSTICDEGTFGECTDPCSTAADCKNPNLPACVVSLTERLTNETTTIAFLCGPPVTVGACGALRPC